MADPEAITQVAPASDPADTGAAQDEQALVVQEKAAEANGEAPLAVDLKAELEKAKAEFAQEWSVKLAAAEKRALDAENLVRTQAGAQSANDRRLNALERLVERQAQRTQELLKAGLTGDEALKQTETAHQKEDETSFASFLREQAALNGAALKAAGFSDSDVDNEELADGLAIWASAVKLGDRAEVEHAVKSLGRGIRRMQTAKQVTTKSEATVIPAPIKEAQQKRISNMETGDGIGAGAVAIATLMTKYGEAYDSLTPAQRKTVEDYMRQEGF